MNQRNDFLPCTSMNITNSFRLFLLSISTFGLSAACATLPRVSETIDEVPAGRKPRQLVSAKGLLSPETSRAIMERLKRSVEPTDLLDRQICVMESISQSPLTKGNKVTLLVDGPATYAAMFKAIQNARVNINLESYIFEDDETGRKFADLLLQKQAAGVQVNLIYDSIGSSNTTAAFFQRLRDGGVQVVEFNQINPLKAHGKWGLIHRDHRKILVADGKVAIVGGVNISQVYSSGISRRKVDVKLIVPSTTDSRLAIDAQRYSYSRLLKAGVKVYERRNALLHAKTAVIDGVWSTVGSTNMDYWSFVSNDEVNAVVLSREVAVEMEKMFAQDLAESEEVQWNTWKRRPLADKVREWVAHLFLRWL